MRRLVLALTGALLAAGPAAAQIKAPPHLRGRVVSLTADRLTIKARDGKTQSIALTPSWGVTLVRPVDAGAIQPGAFIGAAEIGRPGGVGRALEVHIFPPGVRLGEGQYDWDLKPHAKMTSGVVGKVTAGLTGMELDIAYPAGARHLVVPKTAPVVQMGPGDRTMIKPGARVFILAGDAPGGGLIANMIVTAADGAAPPM